MMTWKPYIFIVGAWSQWDREVVVVEAEKIIDSESRHERCVSASVSGKKESTTLLPRHERCVLVNGVSY